MRRNQRRRCASLAALFLAPFMIHELLLSVPKTAFGCHPCRVVSVTYRQLRPFHGGNTFSNLAGNFDLKSLFSVLFDRFYSEDFVLWLGAEEMIGRTAAFQRMADVLEPINTLLEMGLASIVSFRATASAQDAEGNFTTDWETVFGGTYSTGIAVRAWKSRMVIAERIEDQPSPKP